MLPHIVGRLAIDDGLNLCVIQTLHMSPCLSVFTFPMRADGRGVTARLFPAVQGAGEQPADRRGANAGGDGDVAVAQLLRAERQQQAVATPEVVAGPRARPATGRLRQEAAAVRRARRARAPTGSICRASAGGRAPRERPP